ncbi:MAG TPA: hypothetical protein VHC22_17745 [Pirellulales bacterium]|nr:hypothetical protein [Pirellulales bacterium]
MPISVVCRCGKKFNARDEHAGRRAKCSACGEMFTVPAAAAKPATPASVEPTALAPTTSAPAHSLLAEAIQRAPTPPATDSHPSYEGKRVGDWLDLLQVDDPAARKHATEVLSTIGPEAGTELSEFVDRLTADHVLLRHWAVTCLERIGPPARAAVDALVDRLEDDEPLIREKSAAALERVEPACAAFVTRLRRGLIDKDASKRSSAVATFRRDMKTLGISRCRFWACGCGSVYEKEDLEERLKLLADGAEVKSDGTRGCKKCGKSHDLREVYAGKHDVPAKFWPQLIKRFGNRVQLPDDLLAETPPEQGYQLSDSQMLDPLPKSLPSGFSTMPILPEPAADEGYALAAPAPVQHGPSAAPGVQTANELVPGALVPKSGKYKCTACHKVRMSDSKSPLAVRAKTVVQYFKSGKTFADCPHCGDLTEWQFVE